MSLGLSALALAGVLLGVVLAALLAALLVMWSLRAWGDRRWAVLVQALTGQLVASHIPTQGPTQRPAHAAAPVAGEVAGPPPSAAAPTCHDVRTLHGLPAPVRRYFRTVLQDGQPIVRAATVHLAGRFNLSATGQRWRPFTSQQRIVTRRPGFLWDARITLLPGLVVRVVDSYIGGQGLLRAAVLGLFTMADQRGGCEIARGELMRWFAEAAWVPTALLPSQGVCWTAVDAHAARATQADGPLSLSLLFQFDDAGLISGFRAEARGSLVDGQLVMAPWEGRWSDYRRCDGMLVPHTGEVAWLRPDGRKPYFVGTVSALRFEF